MGKRKDHHKQIIQEASLGFPPDMKVIQFHTAQKMPRPLRGVPDLNLQREGNNWWIEIKPRYANYMRDQMSDLQWTWFHERYTLETVFGIHNRYAIVTDAQELINVLDFNILLDPFVWMPDYHWGRYDKWRRGR
jgi:hypothetical protein